MSNDRRDFEPMLNIPTMEELDRQWQEMQREQNTSGRQASGRGRQMGSRNGASNRQAGNRNTTSNRQAGNRNSVSNQNKRSASASRVRAEQTQSKKQRKGKKPKKFKKFRLFMKIFFLLLLIILLGVLVVFYVKYGDDLLRWKREAKQVVEESNKGTFRASETSTIYASNKKPIAKLRGDKDSSYLEFEDIPQEAIDCMVATEDRDFYEHSGVSILSFGKAAVLYVKGKMTGEGTTRGGSTITQQVAKNVFLTNERTEERKIREIFIALEMEEKYTKDEIMEFYLNTICFANGHFGIEAASKAYFSKSTKELDLAEIAFLCAIPNRPTYYNPLENYDATNERKERILKQLLEEGKISAAEYSDAVYEKIILDPAEAIKTQDYMATYAITCATKDLMKKQGFEFKTDFATDEEQEEYEKEYKTLYEECHSSLYTGGYQIYTSLSSSKQSKLQKKVNQTLAGFKSKTKDGVYKLQGAATCIDNETGFVVAVVGGRKQKNTTGYTLNRAFQSYRQPGSSFKPLVVYTPQLERNYTPNTIVDDTYFEGGPKNSDGSYSGKIPLRSAVERSKNVIAWKLFQELTPKVGLKYVLNMNFSQIVDSDYYPAASLGGLTNGVSTVEMAAGYATIENDGIYREPTCIKKITDSSGNVILNNMKNRDSKQVYKKNAARTMTDILEGVLTRGTAHGRGLSNMPSAGKTGTTSDKKDGWFCGYTPYYTTTVWVGYDSPQTLSDLYGSTYPLTIWHDFMEEIHDGLDRKEFKTADSVVKKKKTTTDSEEEEEATITEEPDDVDVTDEPEETAKPKVTKKPVTKTPKPTAEPAPEEEEPVEDIPAEEEPAEDIPDDVSE
ncbi:MAG: transglycosylase domain-containing protein [Butyribacter sp.]|nr:transglycosylase domain-containing protein [bacterium]MDY3854544.1 transglycosylase domain-containing protein [Butyribacter sp.]